MAIWGVKYAFMPNDDDDDRRAVEANNALRTGRSLLSSVAFLQGGSWRMTWWEISRPHAAGIEQPGIQRVQAPADLSRSGLRCHSNETRAPISNPSNSAQLEGSPTITPRYIRVRAVVWKWGKGQTDRHTNTQTAVTDIQYVSKRFPRLNYL